MSGINNIKINDTTLGTILQDNISSSISSITNSGNTLNVTKKDGTSKAVTVYNKTPNITTAAAIGQTSNISVGLSGNKNVAFNVPYLEYNNQGFITKINNKSVTLT